MKINLAGFLGRSAVNGPGIRSVLWVQGCPIHCEGCFNRELWSFSQKNLVETGDLAGEILRVQDTDGVTFSGGEPFAQADALAELGAMVQDEGKTIVTYTGFTYEYLRQKDRPSWRDLLAVTDLLIAGPYRKTAACSSPYTGSSSKSVIPLSDRICPDDPSPPVHPRMIEFIIHPDGSVVTTGFPDGDLDRTRESADETI